VLFQSPFIALEYILWFAPFLGIILYSFALCGVIKIFYTRNNYEIYCLFIVIYNIGSYFIIYNLRIEYIGNSIRYLGLDYYTLKLLLTAVLSLSLIVVQPIIENDSISD
jgi:hypothetical protein